MLVRACPYFKPFLSRFHLGERGQRVRGVATKTKLSEPIKNEAAGSVDSEPIAQPVSPQNPTVKSSSTIVADLLARKLAGFKPTVVDNRVTPNPLEEDKMPSSSNLNSDESVDADAYWKKQLSLVDRPIAKVAARKLDWKYKMGVDPSSLGIGTVFKETILTAKSRHPTKVILTQIGDFFETFGSDAIMVIQYCGLNPMGTGIPRAGCPLANLRRTLNDLLAAGISTCVIEEKPSKSDKKQMKERYEAGVVTPSSPVYYPGLVDLEGESFADLPPHLVLSLSATTVGFSVAACDVLSGKCFIMDDLTEEAVIARLALRDYCQIYTHASVSKFAGRILAAALNAFACVKHSGGEPHEYVCYQLSNENMQRLDWKIVYSQTSIRPRPLYMSTATQIGVLPYPGIPRLVDFILGPLAPYLVQQYTQKLLLCPPSFAVAKALSQCIMLTTHMHDPLPSLRPQPSAKLLRLITSAAANHRFFLDMLDLVDGIVATLSGPWQHVARILGPAVREECNGDPFDAGVILSDCQQTSAMLKAVIEVDAEVEHSGARWERDRSQKCPIPAAFWAANEKGRGRVRRDWLGAASLYTQLEQHATALIEAVQEDLLTVRSMELVYDVKNNGVWLKTSGNNSTPAPHLIRAMDRKRDVVNNRYSTSRVEKCAEAYRVTCSAVEEMETRELRDLSVRLQPRLDSLAQANCLALIFLTVQCHVTAGLRQGWCVASLEPEGTVFDLKQVVPFWLQKNKTSTVANDLKLSQMVLLTGPNMAGKSTLERTVCATALLANCGFMVPADSARVPRFNSIILRNSSNDSPLERMSSFAVEMLQTRTVLRDSDENSLVLLDELASGTESKAGAAVAGAVLQELMNNNVMGLFATHYHELLDLPITCPRMCMEVQRDASGRPTPTWKVKEGSCRFSLALQVAEDMQLPSEVIKRAQEFLGFLHPESISQLQSVPLTSGPSDRASRTMPTLEIGAELLAKISYRTPTLIRVGHMPPPRLGVKSCLYLRRDKAGWWYVGESDAISERIRCHRKAHGEVEFVILEVDNKSQARQLEAEFIIALRDHGFRLVSTHDSTHIRFGSSK